MIPPVEEKRATAAQKDQEELQGKQKRKEDRRKASLDDLCLHLRPFDMTEDLCTHREAYCPGTRQFVDDEFEKWLRCKNASRVFWLLAGPGMGKSVAMAHLSDKFAD